MHLHYPLDSLLHLLFAVQARLSLLVLSLYELQHSHEHTYQQDMLRLYQQGSCLVIRHCRTSRLLLHNPCTQVNRSMFYNLSHHEQRLLLIQDKTDVQRHAFLLALFQQVQVSQKHPQLLHMH